MSSALHLAAFWCLSFTLAIVLPFYALFKQIFSSGRNAEEERSSNRQPPCLVDPSFGCHKYFKRKGVKIHYVESGKKNGNVVLLVHGIPGFWFCWRKQIPVLAAHYRVIAVDLRGCGDSDSPGKASTYILEETMEDILFLINILECPRVYLTCCETSGYLGWQMAERYPHIVSKLIIINCPHPSVFNDYFNSKLYNYVKFWYLIAVQYPLLPTLLLSSKYEPKTLLSLMFGKKFISEDEHEAYVYTFFRKEDWKGSIYHLRQINLKPKLKYDDEITVLSTPTLLLSGSDHPVLPTELSFRSAELVERINIKIIPKCGMHPELSQPSLINQEILRFFQPPVNVIEATPQNESNASFVSRVLGTVASTYRRDGAGTSST